MINTANNANLVEIVNNGPITQKELWGIVSLARTKPESEFNKDVKEIYETVLGIIMRRASEGYGDHNLHEGNCPWCMCPAQTEALRKVANILAEKHKLNVSWYWDSGCGYRCHSLHIDWENEGTGTLKIYTLT